MGDIQQTGGGPSPLNTHEKKLYEQQYKDGVNLFQRAMDEYGKADEMHKKEAFCEVMEQALNVLNDAASALRRPDLEDQNNQIAQDFNDYQNNPSADAEHKLQGDLKHAKRSIS